MKLKFKRDLLEIILMISILIATIFIVGNLSAHQFSSHEVRVKNFFAMEKDTIDVVNIGASEIYTGFSPEYLWKKHGITSYNIATAGAPMGLAENQIKSALKTQKPKLFVISINGTQYDDKRAVAEGYLRMWIDNMPNSDLRDEAIDRFVEGDKSAYDFKILKYHSNILRFWEGIELTKREFDAKRDKRYLTVSGVDGMVSSNKEFVAKENQRDMSKFQETSELGEKTSKQFDDLLNFLEKEKIENVIFVNMPIYFPKDKEKGLKTRRKHNKAMNILRDRGFKVLDFTTEMESIGLDSKKDFYNWGHLNVIGQRKFTEYFYNKVLKDMNIQSKLSDETTKKWEENYQIYDKFYNWAKNIIENEEPKPMKYDYALIDSILDNKLESYEKFLRTKAEIVDKKDKGK